MRKPSQQRKPREPLWHRLARHIPHSYVLMVIATAFIPVLDYGLWRASLVLNTSWPLFVAGVVTVGWIGVVVGILLYADRRWL